MKRSKSNAKDRPGGMAEVARKLGLSASTVSRALSGHPRIPEPTRRRVREAATSLGYRIDASASNLRTRQTRTIAVVIPLTHATRQRLSDPFFLEMLGFIGDELALRGYSMLLSKITQPSGEWIASAVQARRADGVIVIGQSLHHEELNKAAWSKVPMTVWGTHLKGQRYVTVGSDNAGGAQLATGHLIQQGCRRIVFLGDPGVPEGRARLEGYARALEAGGIARAPQLELTVRFGTDTAYDAVSSLLDAGAQFDGVFACSDVIALTAMRSLTERGRRVPADVAVVGFDDIPLAAFTTPPLTTIHQDCIAGARLLVEKVLATIAGEPVESVEITSELLVRASSLRQHHRPAQPRTQGKRSTAARSRRHAIVG